MHSYKFNDIRRIYPVWDSNIFLLLLLKWCTVRGGQQKNTRPYNIELRDISLMKLTAFARSWKAFDILILSQKKYPFLPSSLLLCIKTVWKITLHLIYLVKVVFLVWISLPFLFHHSHFIISQLLALGERKIQLKANMMEIAFLDIYEVMILRCYSWVASKPSGTGLQPIIVA